ncbi:Uncharacterized protein APZ42_026597 [Daphnia magna]|uniref:DUF4371 domain-containing protein n=1 Tax=Daphnia magna TaxID=35525 RepID=A0A164S4B0_9CRUS|nr:Uncharacterized protein APZ42_026597 [Daphnia magna]
MSNSDNGLKKSSRPSGAANRKAKATKDVKEKQLLNSMPKLSKFGFGKKADLNSNGSASASVLLDIDDEDNDEVEIESNVSSNHNVVDIDFHSCLGASNSTEAIVSVELERTNDAGLWGKLSQYDIDYWIKDGPEKCLLYRVLQTDQKNINQFKVLRKLILSSPETGKIFCFPCILFSLPSSTKFGDPCVGFKDWKHGDSSLRQHEDSKSHKTNAPTLTLRRRLFGKIDQHIEEVRSTEGSYWKSLLLRVVAVIKFLCERGLPLRGDNELIGSPKNGNFLGILELMSQFDPFICNHLKEYCNKGKGRSSYLSSTIYEELITIMGVKVLFLIISEIQEARFFSVSIDSTPDLTNVDQLSMIIRYVSVTSHEATERFLSFIPIESHTGEYLANIILKFFEDQNIDIKNARGQSYDNAANISGRWSARADAVKALSFGYTKIQDALKKLLEDLQQTPYTRHQAKSLFDHMLFCETAIMTRLWNSVMERFNILLTTEVRSYIAEYLDNPSTYYDALVELKKRYGRPQVVTRSHLMALMNLPSIRDDDSEALAKLNRTLHGAMHALSTGGYEQDLESGMTLEHVVSRLPPRMRSSWGVKVYRMTPTRAILKDLAKWIDEMVMGELMTTPFTPRSPAPQKEKKAGSPVVFHTSTTPPVKKPQQSPPSESNSSSLKKGVIKKCIYCDNAHSIKTCSTFKDLDVVTRVEWVKEKRLCFRCLIGTHRGTECPTEIVCNIGNFGQRHHPLLHGAPRVYPANDSTTKNAGQPSAKSSDGRAMTIKNRDTAINTSLAIVPVLLQANGVEIVLQSSGKRIGGIGLPQVLPAAGVIKIQRLCSATFDEWVLQASFRQMMPVNVTSVIDEEAAGMLSGLLATVVEQSQPVAKSPIMVEAPAALRTPTRIDLAGTSSHLKAVERLQRQWEEEENAKRYPFEWLIGCLFPLPMVVYLWIEYRRLSSHVDNLLLTRLVEVREPGEEDKGQPGLNAVT